MRARMTLAFSLSITALLLVTNISLVYYIYWSAQNNAMALLNQSSHEISREIAAGEYPPQDIQTFAHKEGEEMEDRGVTLFMLHGDKVVEGPKKLIGSWPLPEREWMRTSLPFGQYTVVLMLPWYESVRHLQEFSILLLALSGIIIAATSLGAWVVVGRTLAPIGALSTQAHRRAIDAHNALLQAPSEDIEVVQLVATLNELLVRLEADTRSKARFYAAASHELRTPLQSLAGFLELGLSRTRTTEEYRNTLQEAEVQSRNLIVLVNDLLYLNQLENATGQPPADDVDLSDVAERSLQRLHNEIEARELTVNFQPDSGASSSLQVPWSHIEMLVRNLVENAVKYATQGKSIQVRCSATEFEVWNECPPVSGWDEEKIFEPFFRPDASRTSRTGGNGLGLAICKAICTANGWQIRIRHKGGGVLAQVNFAAPPDSIQTGN